MADDDSTACETCHIGWKDNAGICDEPGCSDYLYVGCPGCGLQLDDVRRVGPSGEVIGGDCPRCDDFRVLVDSA